MRKLDAIEQQQNVMMSRIYELEHQNYGMPCFLNSSPQSFCLTREIDQVIVYLNLQKVEDTVPAQFLPEIMECHILTTRSCLVGVLSLKKERRIRKRIEQNLQLLHRVVTIYLRN